MPIPNCKYRSGKNPEPSWLYCEGIFIFDHVLSILDGLTMKAKTSCQPPTDWERWATSRPDGHRRRGHGQSRQLMMLPQVYLYAVLRLTITPEILITGADMAISPADSNAERRNNHHGFPWLFSDFQKGTSGLLRLLRNTKTHLSLGWPYPHSLSREPLLTIWISIHPPTIMNRLRSVAESSYPSWPEGTSDESEEPIA